MLAHHDQCVNSMHNTDSSSKYWLHIGCGLIKFIKSHKPINAHWKEHISEGIYLEMVR